MAISKKIKFFKFFLAWIWLLINGWLTGPFWPKKEFWFSSKDFTSGVEGGQHRVGNSLKISFLYIYIFQLTFFIIWHKTVSVNNFAPNYPTGSFFQNIVGKIKEQIQRWALYFLSVCSSWRWLPFPNMLQCI